MKLVVTGQHSLQTLEALVTELFAPIEDKNLSLPDYSMPKLPFDKDNTGIFTKHAPVLDKDRLRVHWILPDYYKEYKTKPLHYFTHLFGHEGEHSLFSCLRKQGLALELASGYNDELNCFSNLFVDILLTKESQETKPGSGAKGA